jgi:hypothetical protein
MYTKVPILTGYFVPEINVYLPENIRFPSFKYDVLRPSEWGVGVPRHSVKLVILIRVENPVNRVNESNRGHNRAIRLIAGRKRVNSGVI